MEFEAAVGTWQDGYMTVSITPERTRVTYTTFRRRKSCFPAYAQRDKQEMIRDLVRQDEKERVQEFFDWVLGLMKTARDEYPSEPRFAWDSAIPGVNWAFILWADDETYCTRGRSGSPAWWNEVCARISIITNAEFGKHLG